MVKVVGWLLVIGGFLLVLTIVFMGVGIPMMCFGISILVAVSLVDRHARKVAEVERSADYSDLRDLSDLSKR